MARIEDLADRFERHIATPWQRTISGAQRVVMLVYDKEMERTLRARKAAFETAARQAGHDWHEIDVSDSFASWMASDEYREEYFGSPEDLQLKLQAEFPNYVAEPRRSSSSKSRCGRRSTTATTSRSSTAEPSFSTHTRSKRLRTTVRAALSTVSPS